MKDKKITELFGEHVWAGKKCIWGLPISFTTYVLTTERLYTRSGFFNIKEDQLELYKVCDLSANYPLGQRMFGCGTLVVSGADRDTPVKRLWSIRSPRDVMRKLEEYVAAERQKYCIIGRDMIGASAHHGDVL